MGLVRWAPDLGPLRHAPPVPAADFTTEQRVILSLEGICLANVTPEVHIM